ncbi:putative leucine-rich repeat-containing protein DDB_G0290503 isoform X2 [Watersipora subatra]|uniref:putative leucine-rich repeat-containing protein DDB_G0290503 isoform X2 n=1 Tax=Watersipora subatra TaxID=2589382 RepID=UPI00355C9387
MAARCRKFVPNLFNKTKCQSCFGAKEAHTAEALESSKAARKISKCAYLFVSPDLDFSNPLHRTKRWQRRFFILYDDGELTYSVDDNPGTIPQGSVDMNKCTDVFDAEERTGHEYSIGITVPNQPSSYVKGTSKDEIQRWFDVLVMYPRSLTIKTKRSPGSKAGIGGVARHHSYFPSGAEKSVSDDEDADSVHSKDSGDAYERSSRTRGRYKQRDVRRSKSEVRPSDLRLAEDEFAKKLGDGSSAGSQTQLTAKLSKDKNIDGLPVRKAGEPETFSSVRSMKHKKAAKNQQHFAEAGKTSHLSSSPVASLATAVSPSAPLSAAASPALPNTDSPDSSSIGIADSGGNALNRRLSIPGISSAAKVAGHKSLGRTVSAADSASGGAFSAFVYPPAASAANTSLTGSNETDEHKIAKNEHARKTLEKSPIVRKGWLLVRKDMDTNVWSKHWFVLCGTSLSYYKDAKAEDTNQLDGVIDVANAYEVSTVKAERNHGFKIKTKEGEYVLSAMTSGIRRNWIDAVEGIIAEIRRAKEKSARQDMGFVFESPIRSPRTPGAAASQTVQPMAPVVPDSSSRVNNALREMAERRRETGDDKPLEELYEVVATTERKDSTCSDTEREVSALTSQPEAAAAPLQPFRQPSDIGPSSPKSPSVVVSPSQRIKEKSRAKTPPRARSPPPPSSRLPSSSPLGVASAGSTTPLSATPAVSSPLSNPHGSSPRVPSPRIPSPRIPSPHVPSSRAAHTLNPRSSHNSTPVDRMMLLPTGNSSDENDDSLTAKLLQSNTQVQKLEQQVQDVNSTVRKQVVEIESLQTKLDLTASQLRDMETALTHSAQNLNKERRNTSKLTEALETLKRDQTSAGSHQEKCIHLEKQLSETTHKLAAQELKMSGIEEKTGKLATLEKVLANTRRHLQDAVDNARETELQYQSKLEELEHDFEEEKLEWQEKLHKMEERLDGMVTVSNNSVNSDLGGQLLKEKSQNVQRLEELVKEQKGKIDQLTEEIVSSRQRIEDLQCYKDRAAVNQNQLDTVQQENMMLHTEFQSIRNDLESMVSELAARDSELAVRDSELASKCQENARLVASVAQLQERCRRAEAEGNESVPHGEQALDVDKLMSELDSFRRTTAGLQQELQHSATQIETLTASCRESELELMKERSKVPHTPVPAPTSASPDGFTLAQVVELVGVVARCCERMTESAVAMLAGEMIETDIKASINFNQEQRGVLGNKIAEQLVKKFSGVRQRLNYIVKHSVSKKQFDNLHIQNEALAQQLAECEESSSPKLATQGTVEPEPGETDYITALLDRCRAEILCISTDITRLDISHVETRLQSLNTALSELDQRKAANDFSLESSIESYCNKLAVQAAATYELARCLSDGLDVSQALTSIENCLKSTSGLVTSIEDISLRNYALLVSERLLISHELDHLVLTGQWKGFIHNQSADLTRKALVTETLHRIDAFCMSKGQPLANIFLNSCISNLLRQNIDGRPTLDMLRNETSLVATLLKNVEEALAACVREHVSLYTSDLVNFGSIEIGEVESLLDGITSRLCKEIKLLASTGNLSNISTNWLHRKVCEVCERAKGLEAKDMPSDVAELALKLYMFESKFNSFSCLITSRETSTLSQSLISEASKLAGLSAELARKSAVEGSTESKIAFLAHRLDRTDRLLATCTSRYSDTVQQVMTEVVHNMQISLLRHQLDAGDYPASPLEQSLTQQVESLKLKLQLTNQRSDKLVNVSQHEKAVEALHDEMSLLKVEHSTELDESKRDMKMVLKSVKAEEYRMATEMTKHIADLESQLADAQRARQAAEKQLERCRPDSVPLEEHAQLKEKVRDLENCLHEMQEEFEEELYQERADHMAELDKSRAELLSLISKSDSQQLGVQDVQEQYKAVIDKLEAERASLQQWIDEIREAHRDEIDALQHERDNALADEVMATQTALETMRSGHLIEVEEMRDKMRELEEKSARLLQVERDLLLQTRESANKDERISQLNGKVSSGNKKLAKLELSSSKTSQVMAELTALNRRLTERNSQLVERFTQELSKGTASTNSPDLILRAQIDALSEKLKLEQLRNSLLKDEVEAVKESHNQLLRQQEEDTTLQVPASDSSSEEMFVQKMKGHSPIPQPKPHPSSFSKSSLNTNHAAEVSAANSQTVAPASPKSPVVSPRKLANKSYDLSRSKSAMTMGKQPLVPRSKRLSNPGDAARAIVLDTNDRGFQQYQKSGGMSIADRMRKFT